MKKYASVQKFAILLQKQFVIAYFLDITLRNVMFFIKIYILEIQIETMSILTTFINFDR